MGFVDESELDPIVPSAPGIGGRFISEAELDPITPSFFEHPIDALTSKDWWLTRPSGERISAEQAVVGPVQKALQGLTFGFGDEITSGIGAAFDTWGSLGADGRPTTPFQDAYSQRLNQARGAQQNLEQASPIVAGGLELGSAFKTPLLGLASSASEALPVAKSIPQALKNVGALSTALAGEGALYSGLYGFGSGEGSASQRLGDAADSAKTGALISGALGIPVSAISEISPLMNLKGAGESLLRKSLGTRQSDYNKTAKEIGFFDVGEEEIGSATKSALNSLEERGVFGKTRDPQKMLTNILNEEKSIATDVSAKIQQFDQKGEKVIPSFPNAVNFLAEGKLPADQIDDYLEKIEKLQSAITEKGGGKLSYLQQQKIAAGSKYNPEDKAVNGFWRAIYHDLQNAIEEKVPEVAGLNNQLKEIKIAKPILQGGLAKKESSNWVDAFFERVRTSGAKSIAGPAVLGAATMGAGGGLPMAILATGAGYAATPNGMYKVGNFLINASKNPDKARNVLEKIIPGFSSQIGLSDSSSKINQTQVPSSLKAKEQVLSRQQSERPTSPKPTTTPTAKKADFVDQAVDRAMKKLDLLNQGVGDADYFNPGKVLSGSVLAPEMKAPSGTEAEVKGDIDLDTLKNSIIKQESGGKAKAVSDKGAQGLMQLMPETGKELFQKLKLTLPKDASPLKYDPFNAKQNEILGTAYIKYLLEEFNGDPELALTAYHTGIGTVKKLLKQSNGSTLGDIIHKLGPVGKKYAKEVLDKYDKFKTIKV